MEPTRADPDQASTPPGGPTAGVRSTVFGLDVRSEMPLSFLEGSSAGPTGRALEFHERPETRRSWTGRSPASSSATSATLTAP